MIKKGKLRGEAVRYPDGVGCCIWYPFDDDDDAGIAFDFPRSDIDDLIALLEELKVIEPRVYKEPRDEETE